MPKISELAAAGALAFTNLLAVVQGGATRKATAAQVGAVIGTYIGARSVLASGAAGDGAADDRGSFVTARDAVPTGEAGRVVVPKGTAAYSLSGPAFGPNGRSVDWEFEPGANIAGGILTRINGTAYRFRARPTKAAWAVTKDIPDTTTGQAVHEYVEVENAGPTTGYGRRYGYVSAGFGPGTYDIAEGSVCTWNRVEGNNGGQSLSQWLVAISPQTSGEGNSWGQFVAEWNVANRGADTGFSDKRSSLVNWTGIFQCVADGDLYGKPGTPTNVTFGIMFAAKPIAGGGATDRARFHAGMLGEPNSISPVGRAIHWSGNDTGNGALNPVAGMEFAATWQHGVKLNKATFTGRAVALGAGHSLAWLDGSDALLAAVSVGADRSILVGSGATARGMAHKVAWSTGFSVAAGDRQHGRHILWRSTSNPAAVRLSSDGASAVPANQIVLPNTSAFTFKGMVVLRDGATAASFSISGLIRRGANAAATAVVGSSVTKDHADAGAADWAVAVTADTTNGALSVAVTGTGSIVCLAHIETLENAL